MSTEVIIVLPWTKIHHIPTIESGNHDRFTTSGPTSSFQSIHLAVALDAAVDNDKASFVKMNEILIR
jgi:hypothetical protein